MSKSGHKPYPYQRPFRMGVLARIGGFFLSLLLLATPAIADNQLTDALHQAVSSFLQQQTANQLDQDIEISVGRIDRRLKLTPCKTAPTPFLSAGAKLQGKLTVGLRCSGPKPWTVYIPAQIKSFSNVLSASHPLHRGNKLSAADVMPMRKEISLLQSGYYTNATEVIGKILTQNLATGHAITPQRIKAPIVVHRGQKVAIIASTGSLTVRGKGEALRDASQGELVSVRNSRSKRIIQGIATNPGIVKVQM